MSVPDDSEFLPCLSDIIMNIRAPITNAKARRKDCERKTAQVSLQCDSLHKMQLQAIANCTHRITVQKSCFGWDCHVSTNRCHVMSLKKIHGILCKVINKYTEATAYTAHKSNISTKGKLELRRKRAEPHMKSVRLESGDISNRFYRGCLINWHNSPLTLVKILTTQLNHTKSCKLPFSSYFFQHFLA